MKIAYCASSTLPSRSANSIHVMKMSQAFSLNGCEVHLVVPNKVSQIEREKEQLYAYYGVKQCFFIKYLPWLPLKGKTLIFGLLAGRYAKKLNCNLFYSRDIIATYFATEQGLPVVFESHFPITNSGHKIIFFWLLSNILNKKNFQYLVVITHSLKSWYLNNYNISPERIVVAPDGADLPQNMEIESSELFPKQRLERFRVGYCGHLYPGKGMEIISKLIEMCPDIEFHIVGGLENDIRYWQEQLKGYENVNFHGYKPHSEMFQIMQQMDVLIAPNLRSVILSDQNDIGEWTSPLKIFEYMSAYKPIIASDIPVLKEVLDHERNALLCDPDNLSSWKLALYHLRDNPILSQKLAQNAYQDLKDQYNWKARAEKILSLDLIN